MDIYDVLYVYIHMSYLSYIYVYVDAHVHVLTLSYVYVNEVMQFRSIFWMTSVFELIIIHVRKCLNHY